MSPHSVTVNTEDFDSSNDGSNPSVAAILAELSDRGWLFNNCYQLDDHSWRVNLRRPTFDGDWFTSWAIGPTFADALEDCMSKLHDAEFTPTPETKGVVDKSQPSTRLDLSALGLRPKIKVERRI